MPIDESTLHIALAELEEAERWYRKSSFLIPTAEERRDVEIQAGAQIADRSRWLVKLGRFPEAIANLDKLRASSDSAQYLSDNLFSNIMYNIHNGDLGKSRVLSVELLDFSISTSGRDHHSTAAVMALSHHIAILDGSRDLPPPEVMDFLENSPIIASDLLDLPRYIERLKEMGLKVPRRNIKG